MAYTMESIEDDLLKLNLICYNSDVQKTCKLTMKIIKNQRKI